MTREEKKAIIEYLNSMKWEPETMEKLVPEYQKVAQEFNKRIDLHIRSVRYKRITSKQ